MAVGVAGAGLISGIIGAGASERASEQQVAAERAALAQQQGMFDTEQTNERPFMQGGQAAQSQLNYLLGEGTPGQQNQAGVGSTAAGSSAGGYGSLNTPFTMENFKSLSPQYQFNLQQGAQGTLNNSSSGQGAESGAALAGLQSYNQNFANNSFNSAFQNYQTQQNNVFDRLSNLATLGSNAGSNSATGASNFSSSIGNTTSSIGASQAAGTVGAANAISGGLQSGAGAFYSQNALNQILNGGSTVAYNGGSAGNNSYQSGTPYGSGANSGDTYTNSDWFLKKNIEPYTFFGTIAIHKFHYRTESDAAEKHFGVIAQEVQEYRPDVVKRRNGYLAVNYAKLGVPTDAQWKALDRQTHGGC